MIHRGQDAGGREPEIRDADDCHHERGRRADPDRGGEAAPRPRGWPEPRVDAEHQERRVALVVRAERLEDEADAERARSAARRSSCQRSRKSGTSGR
jgi:hypothetical protein